MVKFCGGDAVSVAPVVTVITPSVIEVAAVMFLVIEILATGVTPFDPASHNVILPEAFRN